MKALKKVVPSKKVALKTKEKETVKEENVSLDVNQIKAQTKKEKLVGINLGITKNLGDFESLRVDVWITDEILEGETHIDTLNRLTNIVTTHIENTINDVLGD